MMNLFCVCPWLDQSIGLGHKSFKQIIFLKVFSGIVLWSLHMWLANIKGLRSRTPTQSDQEKGSGNKGKGTGSNGQDKVS